MRSTYTVEYEAIYENISGIETNEVAVFNQERTMRLIYLSGKQGESYEIREHWHDWVEFLYVERGNVSVAIATPVQTAHLSSGGIMMIPFGVMHSLKVEESASVVALQVSGVYLSTLFPWYDVTGISCCLSVGASESTEKRYEKIVPLFVDMITLFGKTEKIHKLGFESMFSLFLYYLYENLRTEGVGRETDVRKYPVITRILSYLHQHYREPVSQQEVAAEFSVTPEYLSRLFRKTLGMTWYSYLSEIRLNQAVYELEFTDKGILEILYDCGFSNKQSFYNEFKKRFAVMPAELRRSFSKGKADG